MSAPVAVVIPVWDSYVRWLDEAVASILDQRAGAEVIVVDNASEVPVPEIAGTTVVRAERRLTTGTARNLGLGAVSAPLVVFLDVDDLMLPGSLAALVAGIESHPNAVAFAMAIIDGETGRRHRSPRRVAYVLSPFPRVFAFSNSVWSLLPTQGATIMRTNDVRDAGGYAVENRTQGEDWALATSLAWRGRVRFDRAPALLYRWRDDSLGRARATAKVLANARDVRVRLREDPGVPAAARRLVPLIAIGQRLAIAVVRPLFRGVRRLGPRGS